MPASYTLFHLISTIALQGVTILLNLKAKGCITLGFVGCQQQKKC
jgi:hypothetical protein